MENKIELFFIVRSMQSKYYLTMYQVLPAQSIGTQRSLIDGVLLHQTASRS